MIKISNLKMTHLHLILNKNSIGYLEFFCDRLKLTAITISIGCTEKFRRIVLGERTIGFD